MAPTLQDVAMLLGLPITGDAVGPRMVPSTWLEDLEERFAGVATTIDPEDFNEHTQSKGPSKSWLLQFQPDLLAADADDYSVTRSLEAYLLWLFGYILFNNSHGHCVDRVLLPYAQEIANADEDAIPLYSWGSTALACTYRGLCKASR
ncbi:protein MAIN-LIKE 1-like [Panicum virgatum]|uniref:protein MAIN-LIKE 1-like n=1 Tax=Panicum virgatum TaxID=38727 RepID=UPI0019D54A02|nr:protein MAIN-LIKE 1-like [Panicum virgatum]